MNWQTAIVPADRVNALLVEIRARAGTIACVTRVPDGIRVLWIAAPPER